MRGIDICSQQKIIDFKQVRNAGIEFIIPRDGWGDKLDPNLITYVKDATAAGIAVPGVYHFIYAISKAEVINNAIKAIDNVVKAGLPKSTVIWCDLEYDTVKSAKSRGATLTNKMQREFVEYFCDCILSQGYPTGVYLNQDYLVNVLGKDIANKYDIWLADLEGDPNYPCLYQQNGWYGKISGISGNVDTDVYIGTYTAGSAKPQKTQSNIQSKVDKYIAALTELGDGRYHYYDGKPNGVGCSEYTRLALVKAGIIKSTESFHAASGNAGCLADTSRFQRIAWSSANLHKGDIMWSQGHHVATWDGNNGVYEAAPESTHGICDNGKTGVGHWSKHTYYNCGTGTKSWTCLYRIIDTQSIKDDIKEIFAMDKTYNIKVMITLLPTIKQGSTGNTVKALQTILQKYGWYSGGIDGSCGAKTVSGIKLMQTALGITVDGSCGQQTWTALLT